MSDDGRNKAAAFRTTEVVISSERMAKAEAQRRQLLESDSETVEWIYLRNTDGAWVARRVLREEEEPQSIQGPLRRKAAQFLSALINYQP